MRGAFGAPFLFTLVGAMVGVVQLEMELSMYIPWHPSLIRARPIHVVGCGSLGAKIALTLVRKGVVELHTWDDDLVEEANLKNQPYFLDDIGAPKVDAIARIAHAIQPPSQLVIVPHRARVVPGTVLAGVVFMAVDGNAKRYSEVLPCVKGNAQVSFFADGRVGADGGKAYGFDPNNEWHVHCYEDPLHNHPDPEAVARGCKGESAMSENSDRVAAEMLWRFNRWLHLEQGCEDPYMNHIAWCYTPRYAEAHEYWDDEAFLSGS